MEKVWNIKIALKMVSGRWESDDERGKMKTEVIGIFDEYIKIKKRNFVNKTVFLDRDTSITGWYEVCFTTYFHTYEYTKGKFQKNSVKSFWRSPTTKVTVLYIRYSICLGDLFIIYLYTQYMQQ